MTRTIQPRSYECIVTDWLDHNIYGRDRRYNSSGHYGERVSYSGAGIYTYAEEMGRIIFEGKGRNRKPLFVLLNGDRWSVTSNKHQNILRNGVRHHMSKLPTIIVPFSALVAANIDIDSVRIAGVEDDRRIPIHHESDTIPRHLRSVVGMVEYRHAEWTEDEQERWKIWMSHERWQEKLDNMLSNVRRINKKIENGDEPYSWEKPFEEQLERLQQQIAQHHEQGPQPYDGRIYHTKLEPTGNIITAVVQQYHEITGYHDGIKVSGIREGLETFEPDDDGVWRWVTHRHVLGESVIVADVNTHRMVTCEQCSGAGYDTTGKQPNLPNDWYWTGQRGQDDWDEILVRREFMVPVPHTRRDYLGWTSSWRSEAENEAQLARYYRQGYEWQTWREPVWGALPLPREHYNCSTCRGTGKVREPIKRRNVKFLSGFDHGEPHLAYFFCELPKTDAMTVDEAYEALKPDAVKLAEGMGRKVKRQGDIFAIPTTYTTRELKKNMRRFGRRNGKGEVRAASMLLGTNHQGTEVIHAKDGTIYARGCLWHVPDGRTNDHVRVKLGKEWHIILKNTVPVRRAR